MAIFARKTAFFATYCLQKRRFLRQKAAFLGKKWPILRSQSSLENAHFPKGRQSIVFRRKKERVRHVSRPNMPLDVAERFQITPASTRPPSPQSSTNCTPAGGQNKGRGYPQAGPFFAQLALRATPYGAADRVMAGRVGGLAGW